MTARQYNDDEQSQNKDMRQAVLHLLLSGALAGLSLAVATAFAQGVAEAGNESRDRSGRGVHVAKTETVAATVTAAISQPVTAAIT
jgi:hypothetical protein